MARGIWQSILCLVMLGLVIASPRRPCGCLNTFEFCANDYTTYLSICEYKCKHPSIPFHDWFILYNGPCVSTLENTTERRSTTEGKPITEHSTTTTAMNTSEYNRHTTPPPPTTELWTTITQRNTTEWRPEYEKRTTWRWPTPTRWPITNRRTTTTQTNTTEWWPKYDKHTTERRPTTKWGPTTLRWSKTTQRNANKWPAISKNHVIG
ncbi:uncharacterized protein LOC133516505 [Cydia pomonella]|uniref:uncharacterized protein LOC133516505 n=1 Tax=Cydia pomonella TaxID=82600 RepID=UPI002ADE309F|nr:uncharacterized protein LOC133516505 [Cydia pomonella]